MTIAREQHVPVLIHVNELTQPQGHSTSGSHERYKNGERLAWEKNYDCIRQMRLWMIAINIASPEELDEIDSQIKKEVLEAKKEAWNLFINPIIEDQKNLLALLQEISSASINHKDKIQKYISELNTIKAPLKKEMLVIARKILRFIEVPNSKTLLSNWITNYVEDTQKNSAVIYILSQIKMYFQFKKYFLNMPIMPSRI